MGLISQGLESSGGLAAALLVLLAGPVQTQSSAPAAFEVASVKLTPPGSEGFTKISPPGAGTFTATSVTLEVLIGMAFGMDSNRISGGPSWLGSQPYDVTAKAEGDRGLSSEQLRPLLRQLLEQRFKLSTHHEMKDFPGYGLTVAKGGPKLQPSKGKSGPGQLMILRGGLRGEHMSMALLASMLARPTGRPVADKTGIEGEYDIKIEYAPDDAPDSSLQSIFTALQEQLGLRLIPQKVPVQTLVVDHAERIPTEN